MKAILELRFNPGEGIAYVQSAARGLSLLCCRSRANNETEEIKERELALPIRGLRQVCERNGRAPAGKQLLGPKAEHCNVHGSPLGAIWR